MGIMQSSLYVQLEQCKMSNQNWLLGSKGIEIDIVEELLKECGQEFGYILDDDGNRVSDSCYVLYYGQHKFRLNESSHIKFKSYGKSFLNSLVAQIISKLAFSDYLPEFWVQHFHENNNYRSGDIIELNGRYVVCITRKKNVEIPNKYFW